MVEKYFKNDWSKAKEKYNSFKTLMKIDTCWKYNTMFEGKGSPSWNKLLTSGNIYWVQRAFPLLTKGFWQITLVIKKAS